MANYYSDHPEIEFHLNHPLMKRVVDLKERNYVEKDQFEDAPVNYEDAIENYKRCHPQGRPLGLVHATSLRRLEPA